MKISIAACSLVFLLTSCATSSRVKPPAQPAVIAPAANGKVGTALSSEITDTGFKAKLAPGFHFNEQAPNLVTVDGKNVKPKTLSSREVDFELPKTNFRTARASLYVCDDEKTFCEPIPIPIRGDEASISKSSEGSPIQTPTQKQVTVNHHGFIEDDLIGAQAKAKSENKLLLVDFAARWCPGCLRLEKEVFETKAFKTRAKDFVKVRLDFDRFENLSLGKEKYGIRFIPSLLVLTSDLDEVSRIVDFQPLPTVLSFLNDAKATPQSFAELKTRSDAGDVKATTSLGLRLYQAGRFARALTYLEKIEPAPIERLDAAVQAAKEELAKGETQKAHFRNTITAALKVEPTSTRSIVWRTWLVSSLEANDPRRKILAEEGMAIANDLLANKSKIPAAMKGDAIGEFTGFEELLIASQSADLAEAAGLDENVQQNAKLKVIQIGSKLKIPVTRTGPALRQLIFLVSAKQWPQAEKQARALLRRDPGNPELQRRLLRVLNEQKKFTEAIAMGRAALPGSYGKNEVWVAQQLAKAYRGSGQIQEAKALAQSYLARPDINWSAMRPEQKDLEEISLSR